MSKIHTKKNLSPIEKDDDFLKMLDKRAKRRSRTRKIATLILVLAVLGTTAFFVLRKTILAQDEAEPIYREYSISQGDLTVGLTESSSISLTKETITMPVSSSIVDIYVKSGETVEVGDPLFKYDILEASEPLEDYLDQISEQKILLDKEILEMQNELKSAEQIKDLSSFENEKAENTYNHTLDVAKNNLNEKQNSVDTYEERLNELNKLASEIENDIAVIENLQANIDYNETSIENYQKLLEEDPRDSFHYQLQIDTLTEVLDGLPDEKIELEAEFLEKYMQFEVKDDILEEIETVESSLEKAQIELDEAKISYDETSLKAEQDYEKTLLDGELANSNYELEQQLMQNEIDNLQEEYDDLVEEYDELKADLAGDGVVYSEINGLVSSFAVEVGDEVQTTINATTGTTSYPTILTITKLEDVLVPIDVTEEDILDVYVGQDATVTINAYEDKSFEAVVDSIEIAGARVGAATVTYTVNVTLKDENKLPLMEGMTCEATLINAQVQDVIYVESQAIYSENGVSYVNVKGQNGEPIKTEVKTGFTDGKYTEIKSGVNPDDIIMVESALGAITSDSEKPNMPNFDKNNLPNMPQGFGGGMRGNG